MIIPYHVIIPAQIRHFARFSVLLDSRGLYSRQLVSVKTEAKPDVDTLGPSMITAIRMVSE